MNDKSKLKNPADLEDCLGWIQTIMIACAELENHPADKLYGLDAAVYRTIERLARLGAAIEMMPPNSGLFRHNNDKWGSRRCVMDAVWDLTAHGYSLPAGVYATTTPMEALSAIIPEKTGVE